ncbi:ABC transporter ATP-binding protein [Lagierella sp.]|uniref:ABC transporter ATP-binding protein n=1 Tax=Lagierella sp. TaxID=2849657 RepID=UPI00261998FE|nr:ABC transporter ATP-binding protein [Lagierella sp.]
MKYINNLIKNYRYKSIALVIAVTICNVLALFYNYSFKFVIDAIEQKNIGNAWRAFFIVLILQILVTIFTLLIYDYYLRIFQKNIERDVRDDIMSEILTWPFSESKSITPGKLSTLMTNDVNQIGQYISLYYFMLIANSMRFIITYVLLFSLDKVIGVVVLLSVPLYYILTKFTMKPMQKFVKEGYIAKDQLNNSFIDILNNLMNTKSYKLEETNTNQIKNYTTDLYIKEKKLQKWTAIFYFIRNFLSSFMPVTILGLSIVRIINGQMTLGTLVAIQGFLGAIYLPISELFQFKAMKNNLYPVIDRINPILDNEIEKKDKRKIRFGKPEITIQDLSYSFENNNVINNISKSLKGPGLYRICGDNGKGKSTLFNIISGLYNDFEGDIYLSLDNESPAIAYMNQKNILYDANLYDNITLFGKYSATNMSLKILDKFKNRADDKSDFSGGEKRLILFHRTINCNASIFLFDEPFEGIDRNTKSSMKNIITHLCKNNLVLIISHEDKDFDGLECKEIYL